MAKARLNKEQIRKTATNVKIEADASVDNRFAVADRAMGVASTPEPATASQQKVVRDGFTFLPDEHADISRLRDRAMRQGINASKSAIVRAGLRALDRLTPEDFEKLVRAVPVIKAGRPSGKE